jgi:hypothetical protein
MWCQKTIDIIGFMISLTNFGLPASYSFFINVMNEIKYREYQKKRNTLDFTYCMITGSE